MKSITKKNIGFEYSHDYIVDLWALANRPDSLEIKTPFGFLAEKELRSLNQSGFTVTLVTQGERGNVYRIERQ